MHMHCGDCWAGWFINEAFCLYFNAALPWKALKGKKKQNSFQWKEEKCSHEGQAEDRKADLLSDWVSDVCSTPEGTAPQRGTHLNSSWGESKLVYFSNRKFPASIVFNSGVLFPHSFSFMRVTFQMCDLRNIWKAWLSTKALKPGCLRAGAHQDVQLNLDLEAS